MKLRYYHGRVPNFGDDLNAILWPALMPSFFNDDDTEIFVGIGTIIGFPCGSPRKINVLSSGAGNDPPSRWASSDVKYWCVRGPLSAQMLGLTDQDGIADGAILSPLVSSFPSQRGVSNGVLVIPHWETLDFPGWDVVSRQTGFELLDPRGRPADVIAKIANARLVLTESLHGAIMADVYGVPWAAFATSGNFLAAKWVDWRLSCGDKFDVTVVPPPSPEPLLKYGRPLASYGHLRQISTEYAMNEMKGRMTISRPPSSPDRFRSWLKTSKLARKLHQVSPERTAETLVALADRAREPTAPSVIERQQSRLLERLNEMRKGTRQQNASAAQ